MMRYWDEDRPEWDASQREFAAAWRAQPKWVASRSLKSVGANATLIGGDLEGFITAEQRRYRPQMENYAALLSSLTRGPIWLGLYFPLLGAWREWEFAEEITVASH